MRSILTFVAVVSGIAFIHATNIRLPEAPKPQNLSIPGTIRQLPEPSATEALVYMADSLFKSYPGRQHLFVTNHYHVLYVKTDSVQITPQSPLSSVHQQQTASFLIQ